MKTLTIAQIADHVGGRVHGNPDKTISRAAAFEDADEGSITFVDKPALLGKLVDCRAGVVVVPERFEGKSAATLIFSKNPRLAFAKVMTLLYPRTPSISGISPSAAIGRRFACGEGVVVGPNAFVGNDVTLGDCVIIHPGAYLGDGVRVDDDTQIYPNVTIMDGCIVGKRVIVHSGTVIGGDGYGFTPEGIRHFKIPQVGIVRIEDDVEIGACNTIDRATFGTTLIKEGVKTDNHVHIAHNVSIGAHSLIVAHVGIAGSTRVGNHVTIAGQAGVGGHLDIGDGAIIGPQAGVAKNVSPGQVLSGTPAIDHRLWLRVQREIPQVPELKKQVRDLEKRLSALAEQIAETGK